MSTSGWGAPAIAAGRPPVSASTHLEELLKAEMQNMLKRFVSEESGQDLIEYALLAGLISIVCVLAITNAGTKVSSLYVRVNDSIP